MSVETVASFLFFLLTVTSTIAQDCSQLCACPSEPLLCPIGTSLVLDGCGCSKVCAKQMGEPCSPMEPCDHHKDLYCDNAELSQTEHGTCKAREGQVCDLGGVLYRSGESFKPSCKHQCVCMNGEIGCVPMCPSSVLLPSPDCPYPRRIHIPGKCCDEWVCEQTPQDNQYQSVVAGSSMIHPLPSSSPIIRQGSTYKRPAESPQDNCIVQTTNWSECSAACGMGISSRITNDNQHCQLESQTRICMIRPCNSQQEREIKRGKKCIRTPRAQRWMRFDLSGCSSTRLYRPKFCGVCTDSRCCTPLHTITADVEYRCPEGDLFKKKMMFIKSCSCHYDCPQDNDIFLALNTRRMTGDYEKDVL